MTFKFSEVGIEDPEVDGVLSQILDDNFDMIDFKMKIISHLVNKVELISHEDDVKKLSDIQDIYSSQKQRFEGLQKQEEEYNKNVQVVVEGDE
jgi:hypothetical protein